MYLGCGPFAYVIADHKKLNNLGPISIKLDLWTWASLQNSNEVEQFNINMNLVKCRETYYSEHDGTGV